MKKQKAPATPLGQTYQKLIEDLGLEGESYKSERAKLLRGLRKVSAPTTAIPATADTRHTFVWLDRKGKKHLPQQMATRYLFNAIRMIWNNSVDEYFRIPGVRIWRDIKHWSKAYRLEAMAVLMEEFTSRPDVATELDEEELEHLKYMATATLAGAQI